MKLAWLLSKIVVLTMEQKLIQVHTHTPFFINISVGGKTTLQLKLVLTLRESRRKGT